VRSLFIIGQIGVIRLPKDKGNLQWQKVAESGARSMLPLMLEPQPTCNRPQNDTGERGYSDHHGGPQQAFPERPLRRERGHF
jgi:hypothetical protein